MVKVPLHSTGAASRLTALLLPQIHSVFSVVAPCHPGASPVSVLRGTFTTDCKAESPDREADFACNAPSSGLGSEPQQILARSQGPKRQLVTVFRVSAITE